MQKILALFFISLVVFALSARNFLWAQDSGFDSGQFDQDLELGQDIFTDFSEDVDSKQIQEEERFYRYGRFVSFTMGLGLTTFGGNRGKAYHDNHPSFSLGLIYFADFQNAINIGIEYSKHTMYLDAPVKINTNINEPIGAVDVAMLRPFIAYRYYINTTDLGTLLTYANPYLIGRLEYWYQTNKFREYSTGSESGSTQKGGGIGVGAGLGIEIPMNLEKSFIGVQFLVHKVNFFDRDTEAYQSKSEDDPTTAADERNYCLTNKCYGYDNLEGLGYTFMTSYIISW